MNKIKSGMKIILICILSSVFTICFVNPLIANAFPGVYQNTSKFDSLIANNPIDQDYKQDFKEVELSGSTTFIGAFYHRYYVAWDKELNSIYNKLMNVLTEEEKVLLRKSQRGWLQHLLAEEELAKSICDVGDNGYTLMNVNITSALQNRTRQRTLELHEFYFMKTGKVEFEYISKSKK